VGLGNDNIRIDSSLVRKLMQVEHLSVTKVDSVLVANKSVKGNWVTNRILITLIKIYKGETSFDEIYLKFLKYTSYSLFIFMPFFALVLKVFYRRQHKYYAEFLVFSIYFHTFLFALFTIILLLNKYIGYSNVWTAVLFFGVFTYLGLSLKKVFEQSIVKTIVKTILISVIYVISLSSVIAFLLIGSIL
jgi:hypothetical protein